MVILGLGSNIGDRLGHLREALHQIQKIAGVSVQQVSPIYISDALLPDNAPAAWDTPYLNLALRCETHLTPYELLDQTKLIEKRIGRSAENHWGPRTVDIDLLAWDNLIQYDKKLHVPHEHLHQRPFALWPLADVAPAWIYPLPGPLQGKTAAEIALQWESRFSGNAPLHCRQISQRIDTSQLVGIVNVTPDSFSDGGRFLTPTAACQQIYSLIEAGAEIIDIGAESTRPQATLLDPETEWQRLDPILSDFFAKTSQQPLSPKISIDTRHPEVAKKALAYGADWINDVNGLEDPAMLKLLAEHTCDVVLMHHLGIPHHSSHTLPRNEAPHIQLYRFAEQRLAELENAGIERKRIIFDVGIGYGKTADQCLTLLQNIQLFRQLDVRLLVGHSRKSFLSQFTSLPSGERDIETVTLSLHLAKQGVDYLRVHNVDAHARALKIGAAMRLYF